MEFCKIDIGIDVHRRIEQHRTSFKQSHNDILCMLLGIATDVTYGSLDHAEPEPQPEPPTASPSPPFPPLDGPPWARKRVELPNGTELRMGYQGRSYNGIVSGGRLQVNGHAFISPSTAAIFAIRRAGLSSAKTVNGWLLWHVLRPGSKKWVKLDHLRPEQSKRRRKPAAGWSPGLPPDPGERRDSDSAPAALLATP
jgi:hypothetical protein